MPFEEKLLDRLNNLIKSGERLRTPNKDGGCVGRRHYEECEGWLVAALNLVALVLRNPQDIYRAQIESAVGAPFAQLGGRPNLTVGTVTELLKHAREDFQSGLLASIVDQTRAEVFDDFLDHARAYLSVGRKNPAGVIAGVVFEDTIRRICRNQKIEQNGVKLDGLISELVAARAISSGVAKRARAAAHVRTKATHAQWDEFEEDDVLAAIALTDSLILKHLTG